MRAACIRSVSNTALCRQGSKQVTAAQSTVYQRAVATYVLQLDTSTKCIGFDTITMINTATDTCTQSDSSTVIVLRWLSLFACRCRCMYQLCVSFCFACTGSCLLYTLNQVDFRSYSNFRTQPASTQQQCTISYNTDVAQCMCII
jgi:hypothetical protein